MGIDINEGLTLSAVLLVGRIEKEREVGKQTTDRQEAGLA